MTIVEDYPPPPPPPPHTHTHTHTHAHARTHAHAHREKERERERFACKTVRTISNKEICTQEEKNVTEICLRKWEKSHMPTNISQGLACRKIILLP